MSSGAIYTDDAKKHNEDITWDKGLMQLCLDHGKMPIDVTSGDLTSWGVPYSKMDIALSSLARKTLEYYGVKPFELHNDAEKAKKRYGIKDEHMDLLLNHLGLGGMIASYSKIKIDDGARQYDIPKEQLIPQIPQYAIDKILNPIDSNG